MLDTLSMAKQLTGEYKEVFEKADMYSMMNTVDNTNEKMMDLYDILIEAQAEGKPIEKITGGDIETFCKEFFSEPQEKKGLGKVLEKIYGMVKVIFIFSVLDFLLADGQPDATAMTNQTDILPYICGIIVAYIIEIICRYCLLPAVFKNKKITPFMNSVIILVIFVASIIGSMVLIGDNVVEINNMGVMIVTGGYVVLYLILRSVWRYKKYGRIWGINREDKKIEKEFNEELFDAMLERDFIKLMAKRFDRINRRNRRKGKKELTYQEFAEKVRKEESRNDLVCIAMICVIAGGATIMQITISGVADGLMFGLIALGISMLIYLALRKNMCKGSRLKLQILEQCDKQGIGITEYAEETGCWSRNR